MMRPLLLMSLAALAIAGEAAVDGAAAGAAGGDLARDFATPPLAFKSMPLWHLNGTLTAAEIETQLTAARDRSGFAGVALLPVTDTRPPYLSEEYFARYGDILETSRKLGMKVLFYDDINFPSGSAGTRMKAVFPDECCYRLDNQEEEVTGPVAWKAALPANGIFMGAVAMNGTTHERLDISASMKDGGIAWQVPDGRWTLMVFTCGKVANRVDYLNPASIDRFFSITYDEYYKRFARYFGPVITMTFFDDVGVRSGDWRTWTPIFNERFRAVRGSDPVSLYPALWHDIGPDTASARIALFGFRAELLAEGYPRKVHEWAHAHGIQSSGHAMAQYHPQPSFMAGDAITFYRHSDIPMIDSIHFYGHGRPGFKLTSSASNTYDRPLTAVEIYGNYSGVVDETMLYRSGMELFARGANLFLPHGMWYDPGKVRIKPLISHFSDTLGPALPHYNEWVGRASRLLQGGRHVADIGVLYPIASMQAYARLNLPDVTEMKTRKDVRHPGLCVPPETDLNALSDRLTGAVRRDFTWLHPEILDGRCRVDGALMRLDNRVNAEAYRVIIIPGGKVIHWSNLQKIQAFHDAGGMVIATTHLPDTAAEPGHDQDVRNAIAAIFATVPGEQGFAKRTNANHGAAYFVPSLDTEGKALAAALADAQPVADVRFGAGAPAFQDSTERGRISGMLSYLHQVKDGRHVYFIANSTDERIAAPLTLRGHLALQAWNPHDGTMTPITATYATESGQDITGLPLQLEAVRSMFLVEVR